MAKKDKPDAADESKPAEVVKAPEPVKAVEIAALEMGDHLALRPGMVVRAMGADPVAFDGDINAFVNELSALIHPLRVGVTTREVDRDVSIDGVTTTVKAPEYTIRLLDG